jgi:NitT/TauT family transport system ATP-binding protein
VKAGAHIAVNDLRIRYADQEVIHGISFAIEEGEFVSIVGQSGCGKSSLLHALAGFIEKSGDVNVPSDIGMVFQNYAVFPWLTVRGNIAFGLNRLRAPAQREVVSRHLEMIGLESAANKYPFQLSGGQVQRVALARALAPDPDAIFMDEPFGALDMFTRERMQKWLLRVWEKESKTVLFVTHNIEEAIFLSTRVIVLGQGVILGQFPIPFDRPRAEEVKFTNEFVQLKRDILLHMEQYQGSRYTSGSLPPSTPSNESSQSA